VNARRFAQTFDNLTNTSCTAIRFFALWGSAAKRMRNASQIPVAREILLQNC
jgi:hypothetical protein